MQACLSCTEDWCSIARVVFPYVNFSGLWYAEWENITHGDLHVGFFPRVSCHNYQTHQFQTHEASTVTLAVHARQGLIKHYCFIVSYDG
jgi:hypothetical protein